MPTEPELLRLFDRSPIGMYRSDASGRLLLVNPAMVAILGYDSVDEVLALDLLQDIYADLNERAPVLEDYRDSGFVEGRRVHWKTRTGRILTVVIYGHVVDTGQGLVFDASVIDVTEVDALEADARRARDDNEATAHILDLVVRQMPATYWIVDRDLHIVRTGGAIEQLLGYAADRFLGKNLAEAMAAYPSSEDTIATHRRALAGEIVQVETEYLGKLMVYTVAPYRSTTGAIVGVIGTGTDVTTVRHLERRMVDTQRAESLGVLAGGLAHDFNNLLVAVLGNADLALRDIDAGKSPRRAVENIRIAGRRATELTDQLLHYAGRGGAGTTRVEAAPLLEELLRILAPSIPKDIEIAVDVPAKLAVRGDPAQVRQVLLNLINNARDVLAERSGKISIRAQAQHLAGAAEPDDILTPSAGSYIAIEVEDNGPGMDAETRRHAFEPFFTTKQTGHGLGLAAVLGIVKVHGGGVRVMASASGGTRFQILWPAAAPEPTRASAEPQLGNP